ncbi:biotin synthase BioB [Deltaproteobacteria bacterium TL4]
MNEPRHDWSLNEVRDLYNMPLMELIYRAATVHREYNDPQEVQMCSLLSIKTGGCSEDCGYCAQSARYNTGVPSEKLLPLDQVMEVAKQAKAGGSSRFCMGAAWRRVKNNEDFEKVIEMVKAVRTLDMEVCCTLGMINAAQAQRLAEAGLSAYNHNLDTSANYYPEVVSTRTYEDRIDTIKNVQKAGISACVGGIIGLGETDEDRIQMLHTLALLEQHPESVPVNALVPIEGTPLEKQPRSSVWEVVRMIATARVLMPKSRVRLSAGRSEMSEPEQALCFMAGANSIFAGDKLLTTPNTERSEDHQMFQTLGLLTRPAFKNDPAFACQIAAESGMAAV